MRGQSLTIWCSDQGQHPITLLGDLTWSHGMLRANVGAAYSSIADIKKSDAVWLDWIDRTAARYRVNVRCNRCRRHVQWNEDTVDRVKDNLRVLAATRLDISLIEG